MKERPILFNGQMVKAILEGIKTQTRREITPKPKEPWKEHYQEAGCCKSDWTLRCSNGDCIWYWSSAYAEDTMIGRCLYGQPGDRLWVKETFAKDSISSNGFIYRQNWPLTKPPQGWRPSIHMPRKASRITLEITAVRVERIQAISKADVLAEGTPGSLWLENGSMEECHAVYKQLWESINGKGSWDKNPWVWVIEFKRITP